MKNSRFETVRGENGKEKVEIRREALLSHIRLKLLCLVLAFIIWLLVSGARNGNTAINENSDGMQPSVLNINDGECLVWELV